MSPRSAVVLVALALPATACGGTRQDASEPSGSFRVEVAGASFPAYQHIARPVTLRIRVRNADSLALPNVVVTVATDPIRSGGAPIAFGVRSPDTRLADPRRPVWIVDRGPVGGDTASGSTWALGALPAGRSRQFVWRLMPARAGAFTVAYRLSPGLNGKARPAPGRIGGAFRVIIDDRPIAACVGARGQVIRGPRAAASRCG